MKNKLVFAVVVLVLFMMGAAAGSVVYYAFFLASWLNRVELIEWMPSVLSLILVILAAVTGLFTLRFIRQCRLQEMPVIKIERVLPLTIIVPALNEERTSSSAWKA